MGAQTLTTRDFGGVSEGLGLIGAQTTIQTGHVVFRTGTGTDAVPERS